MEPSKAAGAHDPITENMYKGSQNSFPGDLSCQERDAVIRFLDGMAEELSLSNADWAKQL